MVKDDDVGRERTERIDQSSMDRIVYQRVMTLLADGEGWASRILLLF